MLPSVEPRPPGNQCSVRARNRGERGPRSTDAKPGRPVDERVAVLEAERARLAAAFEQLPAAVVIVEARTGRLLTFNNRAKALAPGLLEGDAAVPLDQLVAFRLDGSPYEAADTPLSRALSGETIYGEHVRMPSERGASVVYEVSAGPIHDEHGNVAAAVITFQDVTERYERERAQSEFIANAAHELRTPLAVIVSAIEVLQAGAKDEPEARERFLDHIERATDRLDRLARALLQLARAQTREEPPKLTLVEIEPILRTIAADMRPAAGVEVTVTCEPGIAAVSNPDLLEQSLSNLARNAAAYTTTGSVSLSAKAEGEHARIEVSDTGPGLPEGVRRHMFERFYRGGARGGDGFGLGLNIAAESVRAVGGRIEITDADGAGTVARVELPLARLVTPS